VLVRGTEIAAIILTCISPDFVFGLSATVLAWLTRLTKTSMASLSTN
jgi:hypothetical protein